MPSVKNQRSVVISGLGVFLEAQVDRIKYP
jgi:hypothetical protein